MMEKRLVGYITVPEGTEYRELGESAQRWRDLIAIPGEYEVYVYGTDYIFYASIPCRIKQQVSDDVIMGRLISNAEVDNAAIGKPWTYNLSDYEWKWIKNPNFRAIGKEK